MGKGGNVIGEKETQRDGLVAPVAPRDRSVVQTTFITTLVQVVIPDGVVISFT